MLTITIKTNRIMFESFRTEGTPYTVADVRAIWEQAVTDLIESRGYQTDVDIGVGCDPSVRWYLGAGDDHGFDWNGLPRRTDEELSETLPYAEYCEDCEDEMARTIWRDVVPMIRRDARATADEAIAAGNAAAEAMCADTDD